MNTIGTLLLGLGLLVGAVLAFTSQLRYFGLVILAATLSLIAFHSWQAHHWTVGYNLAQIGMSDSAVTSLLGNPQRVTDGSEIPMLGIKKSKSQMTPGCVKEYWYDEYFEPSAFALCFDLNDRLIEKYSWSSW